MAVENRIQLRHGSTVPQNGDLLPWELGAYEDQLFIGLDQLDSNGKTMVTKTAGGVGQIGSGNYAEIFNDVVDNVASGAYSHAEGQGTIADGFAGHAEGKMTKALANESHAEGDSTQAEGYSSHAEGHSTVASGQQSHTEGWGTIAKGKCTHVQGRFNKIDESTGDAYANYVHIVGNGSYNNGEPIRSNAHTLDWEGNAWFAGEVYIGSASGKDKDEGSKKLITDSELTEVIMDINAVSEEVENIDKRVNNLEKSDKYIIKAFGGPYPNLNYGSGWAEHNKYYGSCMLIHGNGQSFLFDLGAVRLTGTRSTDENTPLLKYINEKGVKKPLTAIFISHFHGDHYSYDNMRYLWDYGYISGETLVVFPSATNGNSGNYNSQRGYLIHCLGNNVSADPPTPKDPNNIFNYKTSAEVAVIHNGFSGIPSLAGKEVTINIDESHQLIDGETLSFGDVSVECYNIDTKKDGQLKYSEFGLNTTNGKPLSDSTTTTSSDGYYNNYSMINVVIIQGIRIVITGDIAEPGQKEYVDILTKPADLMIVPHHGLEAFIAPELFSRLNSKYSIEQSIYSPAWRKKVSNIFTAELARNGCCTLQTLYGDLVFEIENSQINRVPGERDKEVKDGGNTHLCPNAYCDCAIKWGQNIYELPPGEYITYDAEVAGSIDYEVPAGFTNAGQIKTPKLCSVNGHIHAFRVSVRNTTHFVYGAYPSFRQITITPLLFDSTCTGTLRQAVAVQIKEASEKSGWSDWRYTSMTAT